jgi:outer membrane protein assembly factor BamE
LGYYPLRVDHNDKFRMQTMRIFCWPAIILAVAALTACYKIDIPQGNIIEQTAVERLTPGMSKQQVKTLLGSPMLTDPFNEERWDYVYMFLPGGNESKAEKRHLALFFEGESLSRIEGDREAPDNLSFPTKHVSETSAQPAEGAATDEASAATDEESTE